VTLETSNGLVADRFWGDESTGLALAKAERQINEARVAREDATRAEDRATREALEKQTPSGRRHNFVDVLNGMSAESGMLGMIGMDSVEKVRERQRRHELDVANHNRAHRQFTKSADEGFNRLHPSNRRRSEFEIGPDDPGARGASRFLPGEKYDPPRRVGRVPDAEGSMDSDARTRLDHWAAGRLEGIEPEFLLSVARVLIEAVRSQTRFPEGRRDR
jgi:hypothetical protein